MSKDIFSKQAHLYAGYRPAYPPDLVRFILSRTNGRDLAWDCGTGNGQAALLLAPHFRKVIATDLSAAQIGQAAHHPSIEYLVCQAEQTPIADHVIDLVTVAQAYHWFHFDNFLKEVNRTAKPGARIAVWGYTMCQTSDHALQSRLNEFYDVIVGPYWDPERKHVDDHYRQLPFPFRDPLSKEFQMDVHWRFPDFTGYLRTWSSVQRYIEKNGVNPVDAFEAEVQKYWADAERKTFTFPIFLRMGVI